SSRGCALTYTSICFPYTTLFRSKGGALRGCIGTLEARRPLAVEVVARSVDSARNDPRFPAVTPEELADLEVEVSVLTPPQPFPRSEEHTSELQSRENLVCRLLLE